MLLTAAVPAAAELPPEIVADRHAIQAERLHAKKDCAGALETMRKILALQKEQGFKPAADFHYQYARVALAAKFPKEGLEAVTKYLTEQGRDGAFYKDALVLLEKLEEAERLDSLTCPGQPMGTACWMNLTDPQGCSFWLIQDLWSPYEKSIFATWTGACSGGRTQGHGTLHLGSGQETAERSTGSFRDGKRYGKWMIVRSINWERGYPRYESGPVAEGLFKDGFRHGKWVFRDDEGDLTAKGPYVEGKRHGNWVIYPYSRWDHKHVDCPMIGPKEGCHDKGPYVNGLKHGHWVELVDGIYDGPYVKGKRHGRWRVRRHVRVFDHSSEKWVRREKTHYSNYVDGAIQ